MMHTEGNRYPAHVFNSPTIPAVDADNLGQGVFVADSAENLLCNWETAWIDLGGEG